MKRALALVLTLSAGCFGEFDPDLVFSEDGIESQTTGSAEGPGVSSVGSSGDSKGEPGATSGPSDEETGEGESGDTSGSSGEGESDTGEGDTEDFEPGPVEPWEVCDPLAQFCVDGHGCLPFSHSEPSGQPGGGSVFVWTWRCQELTEPETWTLEDTHLEVCFDHHECGQRGYCRNRSYFPEGECDAPTDYGCCTRLCYMDDGNNCEPGMECFDIMDIFVTGSYTLPEALGVCRAM